MLQLIQKKTTLSIVFIIAIATLGGFLLKPQKVDAACAAQDTTRGTVTSTFSVTQAGTYSVWSRIMPNGTNDSFILEIDGTTCGITVGNANNNATGWQWINYRDGNTASKITVYLPAGNHTMTMIGKEDGVQVDRVLFLSDATCTPTAGTTGDNCANVDNTAPTTAITSPAGPSTSAGIVTIQASATDNVGIKKVEFYMGSTLLGTDTSSPYSFALDTGLYPAGTYQLTVRAYDTSDNMKASSAVALTIPPPPDTTNPVVTLTSPVNGSTVANTINVSASATDNSGTVRKVEVIIDGTVKTTLTSSPFTYSLDTKTLSDGNHTVAMKAYDPSNNSATATATVTVKNATAPVNNADFNNDGKVNAIDLSVLLANYTKTVTASTNGDCDGNGKVNAIDLSILLSKYGQ